MIASLSHQHVVQYANSWLEEPTAEAIADVEAAMRGADGGEWTDTAQSRSVSQGSVESRGGPPLLLHLQMQLCLGTLHDQLKERLPRAQLSAADVLRTVTDDMECARQILVGLAFVHKAEVVHRDLKPANVFITSSGAGQTIYKIGDFGLSTLRSVVHAPWQSDGADGVAGGDAAATTERTAEVGTGLYMAPEQGQGRYGPEVDIYAVGVISLELALAPFATQFERVDLLTKLRRQAAVPPGVHPHAAALIRWLADATPANRPSASMALQAIDEWLHAAGRARSAAGSRGGARGSHEAFPPLSQGAGGEPQCATTGVDDREESRAERHGAESPQS